MLQQRQDGLSRKRNGAPVSKDAETAVRRKTRKAAYMIVRSQIREPGNKKAARQYG